MRAEPIAVQWRRFALLTLEPVLRPTDAAAVLAMRYALTPAESRVLQRLLAGDRTRAIGERLAISQETARGYVKVVLQKCGVARATQLFALARDTCVPRAIDPEEAGRSPLHGHRHRLR